MSKTLSKPAIRKADLNGHASNGAATKTERLPVMKTYKIFIGGKFPRTESGRYYQPKGADGKPLANISPDFSFSSLSSREPSSTIKISPTVPTKGKMDVKSGLAKEKKSATYRRPIPLSNNKITEGILNFFAARSNK